MSDLSGNWIGTISGTNSGRVPIHLFDRGGVLDGTLEVADAAFGRSTYVFVGQRAHDRFELRMSPTSSPDGVVSGRGKVSGTLRRDGAMAGVWETDIGTAGTFSASRTATMTDSATPSGQNTEMKRSSMTPLWVISLFVSLCEVVAGLAVTQASGQVQVALTAFVVGFPVLVAAAFFAILWNRPYVFYPPTEFGSATNVSEYVQALGGVGPAQAAEQQRRLLETTVTGAGQLPEVVPAPGTTVRTENRHDLAADVIKYFAFRQMRYSDVSNPETRAVFNLGAFHGFNLFDGVPGIVFFGYFPELPAVEIVARVRFLFNNISLSFKRVREHQDPAARETALRILNQLSVEVLVPESADVGALSSKIAEYRPDDTPTPVRLVHPSDVQREVEKEYARMGLA